MRKSMTLLLAALLLAAFGASARVLSPAEALEAALADADGPRRAAMRDMSLRHSFDDEAGVAAVYLFGSQKGETFALVAADDCATALLGYGDNLDAATLPDNFRAWVDQYARRIEWLRNHPAAPLPQGALRVPRKAHAAISPMVKTKWNQTSPYNNDCPVVGGSRSVTGCIATAMAQVMNYYRCPTKGTGSYSYSFKYNGTTYSDSFNFGATTFDWDNMLNTYTSSSSTTAKKAVSTLMHACGVASRMSYSPSASGTNEYYAGAGMIKYLGYDAALFVLQRDWFGETEWDAMIYDELEAGRPVLYNGLTANNEGHAFVCDGYNGSGYYHINWGWGGMCDGYFLLSNLDPEGQGTGGSASDDAFNYGQSASFGVRPAVSGSKLVPVFCFSDGLSTTETSYSKNGAVRFDNGYYNMSTGTADVDFGISLLYADGTRQYKDIISNESFDIFYGFSYIDVYGSTLPVGEYDVALMVRPTGGSEWLPIYNDVPDARSLHLSVTSSKITVSAAKYTDSDPGQTAPDGKIQSITPVNPAHAGGIYQNAVYNVTSDFTAATGDYMLFTGLLYIDSNNKISLAAFSDIEQKHVVGGTTLTLTQELAIPYDASTGEAYIALCIYDSTNGSAKIVAVVGVEVLEALGDEVDYQAKIVSVTAEDISDGDKIISGHSYRVKTTVTSTGACTLEMCTLLTDAAVTSLIVRTDYETVSFTEAGSSTLVQILRIPENLTGEACIAVGSLGDGYINIEDIRTVNITSPESEPDTPDIPDDGLDTPVVDARTPLTLYLLDGRRVERPEPGTIVVGTDGLKRLVR